MGDLSQVFRGECETSTENWKSCYSSYTLEEIVVVCPENLKKA